MAAAEPRRPPLSQDGRRCAPDRLLIPQRHLTLSTVSKVPCGGTSLAMRSCASVHDARTIIDLMEEGGTEDAEIIKGHAHILRHPMRGEDAGGVQTL